MGSGGLRTRGSVTRKVSKRTYVSRYVQLRHCGGNDVGHFGDGSDFERGTDNDNEVGGVDVMLCQPIVEFVRQVFTEEGNVGLFLSDVSSLFISRNILHTFITPAISVSGCSSSPLVLSS